MPRKIPRTLPTTVHPRRALVALASALAMGGLMATGAALATDTAQTLTYTMHQSLNGSDADNLRRVLEAERLAAAAGESWADLDVAAQDRYFDRAKCSP